MAGKKQIHDVLRAGIPIAIGYFPAAVAFGILAKSCGLSLLESFLFSAVVFAGASQFIALNLLMAGTGPVGIVLTTLLVNFRHFLMSAYLSTRLKNVAGKEVFVIAFGVTDEVFSVLSFTPGHLSRFFVISLQMFAYGAWVSGSVAGFVLGGFLPQVLTQSMGVALYALLLAILLPEIKKSYKAFVLTAASGLLNMALIQTKLLPAGWTIIVCILVIALIGAFWMADLFQEDDVHG